MKEKTKEIITKRKELSRGITLIALVITIIVLLILAGVTIATLTGDNGLLTKASGAKNTSTEAEIMEKIKLAYQDYYLGQHTNPEYTFQAALDKMFGENVAQVTGEGPWTITIGAKSYTLSTNGTVIPNVSNSGQENEAGNNTSGVAISTLTKDNYGDYIDLGQNVVGSEATTDDWRILYNDKSGHVYAILADYLPNNNAAVAASNLSAVGGNVYGINSMTGAYDLLNKLNTTTAWQGLIPEELRSSCQVKGAATAEIIMASYNEKYGTSLEYTDFPELTTNPNDNSPYNAITTNANGIYGYWLLTPSNGQETMFVVYENFLQDVMTGDVETDWDTFDQTFIPRGDTAVRPVVSLPSDIQVTKNGIVWTVVQ